MVTTSKLRVLIVEDHPDSRFVMVLAMEAWGYEVLEARDGKEALALITLDDFNLAIIDIAMPFVSGREVGRSIKSNPRIKHIPILAVTALDGFENREMCLQAGFDDFLSKPYELGALKTKVEALLGSVNR